MPFKALPEPFSAYAIDLDTRRVLSRRREFWHNWNDSKSKRIIPARILKPKTGERYQMYCQGERIVRTFDQLLEML